MVGIVQAIDSYIVCFIFLAAVCAYIAVQLDLKQVKNKFIVVTAYLVMAQLVVGAILQVAVIDVNVFPHNLVNFLYTFSILNSAIIAMTITMFIFKYDENDFSINPIIVVLLVIPVLLSLSILIENAFTHRAFIIDANNVMIKGNLYFLTNFFIVIDILVGMIYLFVQKNKFTDFDFKVLMSLEISTLLLIVLRKFVPELDVLWTVTACNLSVMLLLLQRRIAEYDSLTRAYSRRVFDTFIENKIAKSDKKEIFAAMFIDLDEFKAINDNFGHSEGDIVLRRFVELLYQAVGKKAKVVRYGGDEFLVYLENPSKENLKLCVLNIAKVINEHNESSGKNYNVKYSLSSEIYTDKFRSFDQFLRKLDNKMYKSKKAKKMRYDKNSIVAPESEE